MNVIKLQNQKTVPILKTVELKDFISSVWWVYRHTLCDDTRTHKSIVYLLSSALNELKIKKKRWNSCGVTCSNIFLWRMMHSIRAVGFKNKKTKNWKKFNNKRVFPPFVPRFRSFLRLCRKSKSGHTLKAAQQCRPQTNSAKLHLGSVHKQSVKLLFLFLFLKSFIYNDVHLLDVLQKSRMALPGPAGPGGHGKRRVSESEACSVGRSSSLSLFVSASVHPPKKTFWVSRFFQLTSVILWVWWHAHAKSRKRNVVLLETMRQVRPHPEVEGGVAGGPSKTWRGNGQKN